MAQENPNSALSIAQESSINEFSAPEARFECPICLSWLRDPVVTSCGHRFCRSCIQNWLNKESACPVDNMKLKAESDIFPDNFTRREISQQKTKCPNIKYGCLMELSPLDVESHLLVCEFRPPELPECEKLRCSFVNVGCEQKFEDEPERQKHLEQSVQHHLFLLSQAYTQMSNISEDNACSTLAQANFWDPPSKGNSNSELNNGDNLQNLLRALYERIVFLEQKSREQDIIISNMSQQINSFNKTITTMQQRHCNGSYVWHVNDFKSKINSMRESPRVMYYSPCFYTSVYGYKLCLRMNLSPKTNKHIAILIHLMKSDHDCVLNWPFCGKLSVTIVHPSLLYRSIKETMMSRSDLEAFKQPVDDINPKGFGYTEFAYLDELIDEGYIVNNKLIISIEAKPI